MWRTQAGRLSGVGYLDGMDEGEPTERPTILAVVEGAADLARMEDVQLTS